MPASSSADAPRAQGQIAVVDPAIGPATLASPTEFVVKPTLLDRKVLHDPLRLEQPAIGSCRSEVFEDLFVGDSMLWQVRPDPGH